MSPEPALIVALLVISALPASRWALITPRPVPPLALMVKFPLFVVISAFTVMSLPACITNVLLLEVGAFIAPFNVISLLALKVTSVPAANILLMILLSNALVPD